MEEWAPVFFVALVARLVNDPSAACRDMYEQALTALLQVRLWPISLCCTRLYLLTSCPVVWQGFDLVWASRRTS